MDQSSAFLGSDLLENLRISDRLSEQEGMDWIARRTGRPYDAWAMYLLAWSDHEDPKTWGEFADLRIHVMSDRELDALESVYRSQHHLPQRRPWEARMFEQSRGRRER